jgi:prolyl-tRNA synthetase
MSASKAKASSKTDAELIGITTKKDGDFSDWYQQVLKKGDMLDYYDVSGCYILKPWSYNVWQSIQSEYVVVDVSKFDAHLSCYSIL